MPTATNQTRPSPTPDCIEVENADVTFDMATKAIAMLQQKTLTAEKKAEIAEVIKTMAQTITALKTRNSVHHEHPHKECHEAFQAIKQELTEIRESMATNATNVKTYAQIAAAALITPTSQVTPSRQLELAQARKERAEYEITLSASGASDAIKDKLRNDSHKEITEKLQQAINAADLQAKPVLKSVNKMSENTFRLYFQTPEDTEHIKNAFINWNITYDGLDIHKPKYGIVVHGIPIEAINLASDYTATVQQWEEQNGLKICSIVPLKHHPKHRPTKWRSLIIFTHDHDTTHRCLMHGFFIDNLHLSKVEKYTPHLYICQCFKCQCLGHRAADCNSNTTCGNCAQEEHTAETCPNKQGPPKCVNCSGEHVTWLRECPTWTKEGTKLAE